MRFLKLFFISIFPLITYSQATLPLTRTTWDVAAPTGWTDGNATTPAYTTTFACSGSNGGRLDNSTEYYTVFFSGAPGNLDYTLKVSGATTSSCLVEESPDGSSWTTIVDHTSLPTTCTPYVYTLLSNTRYARWTYTKVTNNLTIDDVQIVAAPCTAPTTQALNYSSSAITTTSMTANWDRGNGDAGVLVIAKAGSAPTDPVSGTAYTANAAYGSGDAVGGGFAVYQGTGTSVNLTGLSSSTTYYFAIYEYNATGTCYLLTELTGNATTLDCWPSTQASAFSNTGSTTTSLSFDWVRGNGDNVLIVARSGSAVDADPVSGTGYTANSTFGSGSQIGTGNYVVYSGAGTSTTVNGLSVNTTYHFAIYEFNNAGTCYNYTQLTGNNTTLCNTPTVQATGATASAITSTTATVSFTAGDGDSRLVIVEATTAITGAPADGTTYTANANFSSATNGTGFNIGEKTVYANTGTSVNITNLTANTTYNISIFEYNNATKCYLTTAPSTTSFTTSSNSSDIITSGGESATVTSIENTAGPLTSVQGVQVWQFTIRDGGASSPDADALPTILANLTITQNAGNAMGNWTDAILSADIFDGATHIATATITSNQLQFTGMSFSVADNGTKTISLRISLNCGMSDAGNIDGDDFVFQISQANVTEAGSGTSEFSTFSSINSVNGQNAFDVVATELQFGNQPASTGINLAMSTVTVKATDACGNTDLGFSSNINISSSGTLTGDPVTVAAVSGTATYNSLTHTVLGTSLTLTASSTGLTGDVSSIFDIVLSTTFEPGDFAIVAVNTQRLASGSADEVCFITFKNLTAGTSFEITDNGYERLYAGQWGNTEGIVRFTRNLSSPTIASGTVICIEGPDNTYDGDGVDDFDIYICGVKDDANWGISSLSDKALNSLDWNDQDQVWILQGGTWTHNTNNGHDDTYNGSVLYGWTAIPWEAAPGYSSTAGSTLYPNAECFNTDVATPGDKTKYTGPTTAATKYTWLARINNETNWTNYVDADNNVANGLYDAGGTDYYLGSCASTSVTVNAGTETEGKWNGNANVNWFDCENWETLTVPDASTTVTLPSGGGVVNEANISVTGALCDDIQIQTGRTLTINNTGVLSVYGDFDNDGTLTHTAGSVTMTGTSDGVISGDNAIDFYNWVINKTASNITLSRDVEVSNNLTFTDGVITSGVNKVIVSNTAHDAISGYSSASFINGNLRRNIATNAFDYEFPVGYGGTGAANYHPADIINNNLTGVGYIDVSVNSISEVAPNDDATFIAVNVSQDGTQLTNIVETAEWSFIPDAAPTGATTYGVKLYVINTGLSGADDGTFCPVKRPDASVSYADWSTDEGSTAIPADGAAGRVYSGGAGYAQRTGYGSFSRHAIAGNPFVLPIELLHFDAKYNGKDVDLNWATASETNNDYFQIERSSDAWHFNVISETDGAGNSNEKLSYYLPDTSPLKGISYYRLKQTDFDGKYAYSDIKTVNISENKNELILIQNNDQVSINNKSGKDFKVEVYNAHGQLIKQLTVNTSATINKQEFSSGIYFIRAYNGTQQESWKIQL